MNGYAGTATEIDRGERYRLLRDDDAYVVVDLRVAGTAPVERFPLDRTGWHLARRRCNELAAAPAPSAGGAPGFPATAVPTAPWVSSTHAGAPSTTTRLDAKVAVAGALLLGAVALGSAALFPAYLGGTSLADQGFQLVIHVSALMGWALAAVLVLGTSTLRRAGAAFGLALSALGGALLLVDLAVSVSGGGNPGGPGLYLALVAGLLALLGSAVAYRACPDPRPRSRVPSATRTVLMAAGAVATIGTIVTFVPSWDRYVLYSGATGRIVQTVTAGNAFDNPGLVVAANVLVLVVFALAVAFALSRRRVSLGVAALSGALVPLVAQLVSAVVQNLTPPAAARFGIGPAEALAARLQVSAGFTQWFYGYCGFVALLIAVGALSAIEPDEHASPARAA